MGEIAATTDRQAPQQARQEQKAASPISSDQSSLKKPPRERPPIHPGRLEEIRQELHTILPLNSEPRTPLQPLREPSGPLPDWVLPEQQPDHEKSSLIPLEAEASKETQEYRKQAEVFGHFYAGLIKTYLRSESGERKEQEVEKHLETLPPTMRYHVEQFLQNLQGALQKNHALLANQPDKVGYLLRDLLQGRASEETINEYLSQRDDEDFTYLEPTPGLVLLQVSPWEHRHMRAQHIVPYNAEATRFGATDEHPDFIVFQKPQTTLPLEENTILLEEVHHTLWKPLQDTGIVQASVEKDPAREKAFKNFRNEMIGHLLSEEGILFQGKPLVPSDMPEELADITNKIGLYIEIAKASGMDASTFIYPTMQASDFQSLIRNIDQLTPSGIQATPSLYEGLIELRFRDGKFIQAILEEKQVKLYMGDAQAVPIYQRMPQGVQKAIDSYFQLLQAA